MGPRVDVDGGVVTGLKHLDAKGQGKVQELCTACSRGFAYVHLAWSGWVTMGTDGRGYAGLRLMRHRPILSLTAPHFLSPEGSKKKARVLV